jgi:hypothetical protein
MILKKIEKRQGKFSGKRSVGQMVDGKERALQYLGKKESPKSVNIARLCMKKLILTPFLV